MSRFGAIRRAHSKKHNTPILHKKLLHKERIRVGDSSSLHNSTRTKYIKRKIYRKHRTKYLEKFTSVHKIFQICNGRPIHINIERSNENSVRKSECVIALYL